MSANPYSAPQANIEPVDSEQEAVRKEHINNEASIKAVGILYYLNCAGLLFSAVAIAIPSAAESQALGFGMAVALGALAVLIGAGGVGLRGLKGWGRIISTIMSVVGLIGFPIGTLISGYILYLLWGKKGRVIFSPEYQAVIAATPHVKYKTSIVVWILLGLVVVLILAGIGASVMR